MTIRHGSSSRCSLAALLMLSLNAIVSAEPLTRDEVVRLALERAPAVEARRLAVASAQSGEIAAGRLPDPELILGLDNVPTSGPGAWSLDEDFMTMRKVGVMQSFPNRRKREAERERAAALVVLAQGQDRQTQLEVARAAADAWVMAATAQLLLDKLRDMAPEVDLQSQIARAALASARGSTLDALAAESARSTLADQILEAERDVTAERADLAQWIGADAERPIAIGMSFGELPQPREKLLGSLHRHPELQIVDAQRSVARSEVDLAKADKHPDWSTSLSYGGRGAAFSDMVSLEFRVGLPLFGTRRQDPQIAARSADVARLEAERESELRMHTYEITSALAAWDAARARLELYDSSRLPLARERSRMALAGYRTGTSDLATLLASHLAELDLQREHVRLLRDLGRAWVYLRYLDVHGESP